jgi:hypothetical protein
MFAQLLKTTKPFAKYDITYKSDFIKSIENFFSIECTSFTQFLEKIKYNIVLINVTNEPHVNYFLRPIADINDATMMDSIMHIKRKNHMIQELPTISAINEYTAIKNSQKNNYNRLFGLNNEKNADPLKHYKISLEELASMPAMDGLVTEYRKPGAQSTITLFVSKYKVYFCKGNVLANA